MIKTLATYFIGACAVVAVWKSSGGDSGQIIDGIWNAVDRGSEVLTNVFVHVSQKV